MAVVVARIEAKIKGMQRGGDGDVAGGTPATSDRDGRATHTEELIA